MKKHTILFGLMFVPLLAWAQPHSDSEPVEEKSEYVILLHGLSRSASSMSRLESRLAQEGYTVVNVDYPSTEHPIEYL